MHVLYTAVASATSGRDGKIASDDGNLSAALSVPKGLGGPGGTGTNPEQLFAAGYAACFGSAVKVVAGKAKLDAAGVIITAHVSIGKDGDKFGLGVTLEGKFPGLSKEQAHGLMEAAHQVCPYSNATRGNVEVVLSVV